VFVIAITPICLLPTPITLTNAYLRIPRARDFSKEYRDLVYSDFTIKIW
jgi:hypothetical protein